MAIRMFLILLCIAVFANAQLSFSVTDDFKCIGEVNKTELEDASKNLTICLNSHDVTVDFSKLCEKSEDIFKCVTPVEQIFGKCLNRDIAQILPVAKKLIGDFCTFKGNIDPTKFKCLIKKKNMYAKCARYFDESFADKDKVETITTVLDIFTTDKHCCEIFLAKRCFHNVIKDCTQEEKTISEKFTVDLISATKCVGLESGAKTNKLSAFLSVVITLTLLYSKFS